MNNERFKQKMAALEEELDAHIARLTPESRQEFEQKQNEYHQHEYESSNRFTLDTDKEKLPKNKWA